MFCSVIDIVLMYSQFLGIKAMKKIYPSLGVVLTAAMCSVVSADAQDASKPLIIPQAQSIALTNGMTFTIGGKGIAEVVGVSQRKKDPMTERGSLMFKGNLNLEFTGKTNDWDYGLISSLNLDRSSSTDDIIKVVYLFASSEKVGTIQVGNLEGLERQMMSTGKDVMGGADAYTGRMWRVVNTTSGVAGELGLPASYTGYSTKAVYISPNVNGWQAGVHYVPSSATKGTQKLNTELSTLFRRPSAKQLVTAALNYGFGYGQMAVSLYANGSIGKAQPVYGTTNTALLHPIKTFQFGMLMDYAGWRIGSGYFNNQRSYVKKGSAQNGGQGYDFGIGREMGPVYVALGYAGFCRKIPGGHATSNVGSATVDYTLVPGWTLYGEADVFRMRRSGRSNRAYDANDVYDNGGATTSGTVNPSINGDNNGAVFILGTQMRF